ncbi:MAG: hypothetical protein JXR97_08125 [Planctomycetes bacterium]|nr:hypothetical protein [Planctomycetota bacterium]
MKCVAYFILAVVLSFSLSPLSKAAEKGSDSDSLRKDIKALVPFHVVKAKPKPGEWLAEHGDNEKGQTFEQYLHYRPVRPSRSRRVIYLQRLGEFSVGQKKALDLTAEYMRIYFGLAVKFTKDLPLSVIPDDARRVHPEWGVKQVLTTYILDDILKPKLPKDGVVFMCFTSSDLWPGGDWNFVFGQAAIRSRVGVQSLYRNGNADGSEAEFLTFLRRTIRTATHETGHMFSMHHCIKYECNMNGSNSREESDGRPTWLCPECMAKLCWAMGVEPVGRYRKLYEWFVKNGMQEEAGFMGKSILKLGGKVPELKTETSGRASRDRDMVKSEPVKVE